MNNMYMYMHVVLVRALVYLYVSTRVRTNWHYSCPIATLLWIALLAPL